MLDAFENRILKQNPLIVENSGTVLHPHSEEIFTDNFRRKMFMIGREPTVFNMYNGSMFFSDMIGNNLIVENYDMGAFGFLNEEMRYNNWLGMFIKKNFLMKNAENGLNKMIPNYILDKIYKETVYYRKNNETELNTISLLYLRDEVFQGKCFIVNPLKFVESMKEDKLMSAIKENMSK